ncbi:MAG: hypothetical protein PHI66_04270 [Candidatus Pacebacteria bacterium]|nr:hypothetical protein [Candidatus Paceibacterota bacterium]
MENQKESIKTVRWEIGEGYFFRAAQNKKVLTFCCDYFISHADFGDLDI